MMDIIINSPYFGVALTLVAFLMAVAINRKFKTPLTTPLFLGTIFVIAVLTMANIPYDTYNSGAKYMTYMLTPLTISFAVPMYKQLPELRRHALAVLMSVLLGVVYSVVCVIVICIIFGLGDVVARSFVAVSVTTAIAIEITEKLGGIVALTVSAVVMTGILGASVSDIICKKLKMHSPIARGLAIGNAAHVAGTTKAMEMGETEGAFSSLAIVLSGLFTAIIAPFAIKVLFW